MKRKTKGAIAILLIGVVCIVFILINGIVIDINGVISVNTKYYNTALEAFTANNETDIPAISDICVEKIDEYNSIYLAKIDEHQLIVAQMKTKDEQYYYMGNCIIYNIDETVDCNINDFEKYSDVLGLMMKSSLLYDNREIKCCMVSSENSQSYNNTGKYRIIPIYNTYYFVYCCE